MKIAKIKLINPRGRIIEVMPKDVSKLLARGFMRAPNQVHQYNPVFDRLESVNKQTVNLTEVKKVKRKVLKVEKI